MKIKTISRGADSARERSGDIYNLYKNPDPLLHPFEQAREYSRALVAAKKDRIFAKPFIGSLSGHTDGVYTLKSWEGSGDRIISGSGNGEVQVWNLSTGKSIFFQKGHTGFVRGLSSLPTSFDPEQKGFISIGEDGLIKFWNLDRQDAPNARISHDSPFTSLSHHFSSPIFVTTGDKVEVWNHEKLTPIQEYSWGVETAVSSRFNKSERNIFLSSGNGRSVTIYDLRMNTPVARAIMSAHANDLEWSPMEPLNFTTANDDFKCYTFDMRHLDVARYVYKGSVSSVMSISYSPTGEGFATGSYDTAVRVYNTSNALPVDIYHTKRMQRVFCVCYSSDGRFVISGSDEGNIRLWKTRASEKLGILSNRESSSFEYSQSLINKYKHMDEIRRITRSRRIPSKIKKESDKLAIMTESKNRKLANLKKYSKPKVDPFTSERKKGVVRTEE